MSNRVIDMDSLDCAGCELFLDRSRRAENVVGRLTAERDSLKAHLETTSAALRLCRRERTDAEVEQESLKAQLEAVKADRTAADGVRLKEQARNSELRAQLEAVHVQRTEAINDCAELYREAEALRAERDRWHLEAKQSWDRNQGLIRIVGELCDALDSYARDLGPLYTELIARARALKGVG